MSVLIPEVWGGGGRFCPIAPSFVSFLPLVAQLRNVTVIHAEKPQAGTGVQRRLDARNTRAHGENKRDADV